MAGLPKVVDLKELMEMGFLYEINRRVLHPHGMALSVKVELASDGSVAAVLGFGGVIDDRDDPEGFIYGDEDFFDGRRQWRRYMRSLGGARLRRRRERLGFAQQTKAVP